MNFDHTSTPGLRPALDTAGSGTIHSARVTSWEPKGQGASRVVIGVAGAALVGMLAIGGVLLAPSKQVARPGTDDQVATAPQSQETNAPVAPAAQAQETTTAAAPAPTVAPVAPAVTTDPQAVSKREPTAAGRVSTRARTEVSDPATPVQATPSIQAQPAVQSQAQQPGTGGSPANADNTGTSPTPAQPDTSDTGSSPATKSGSDQ